MLSTTKLKDPVCGMDVDQEGGGLKTAYKGQLYLFCGAKCKEKFDADPEEYAGKAAGSMGWL